MSAWVLNTFFTREKEPMLTLFNSLIRSKLEFCCQVWSPYKKKDIARLEQIQRSFTFRIRGLKHLNYWERLKDLNIMSLQRRRERCILLHIFKIYTKVYPNTIDLEFKTSSRSKAVRAVLKPLPRVSCRLGTLYDSSFIVYAAKLWNILPPLITQIDCFKSFVTELDSFLSIVPDHPPLPGYPNINDNSLVQQCF